MVTPLCLFFTPPSPLGPPPPALPPLPGRLSSRGDVGLGFAVFSSHSNARILKSNGRPPYGRQITRYQDEEDDEEEEEDEEDEGEESDDEKSHARSSSDGEYSDCEEYDRKEHSDQKLSNFSSGSGPNSKSGNSRLVRKEQDEGPSRIGGGLKLAYGSGDVKHNKNILEKRIASDRSRKSCFTDIDRRGKIGKYTEVRFQKLTEELDFDEKWFPLIDYLSKYGLKESHFISIYERHMPCLQINVASAKERLEYLLSMGVKERDIRRILLRQPQILEYTVENNLKPHVAFLGSLGVPDSRIGQIITAAPSLFSYNVENSLKPTVRYLVEEVGIKGSDVSKVVQLSPQILVQRIDSSWNSRFYFLSKELGAPRDNIVKMVTKHPQLLHYSIEDGIQPRINFLRSIGMRNSEILKVLTSLAQVLSLSLEGNLKPKYLYLVNELHNEVQSLTKYPMYLSLSLEQRIRPRHRFLVSLKKAPKGPFPLSSLVPTDECFCRQWADTSLDKYLAFRQTLLLTDLAKKYKRK